jgi:CO/xanthine dehydrogenase FAD-binding subunit
LKPPPFDYHQPATLNDVFDLLDHHGDEARLIAGGQSLIPLMNLRLARPRVLIDLAALPGLSEIRYDGATVRIGAMTRHADLLMDETVERHLPILRCAAGHIGHVQIRSRGTIGGSLANADPSAELPLVMVTLGATFTLRSATGARNVPAREFFVDVLTTVISQGEVLTEVIVPVSASDTTFAFREIARRHGDFAIVSAAAQRSPSKNEILIGVGGLGPVPHFCDDLCKVLSTGPLGPSAAQQAISDEISRLDPISDLHATGDYRRRVAAVLIAECLEQVLGA